MENMSTITVSDNITFHYTDSGPVQQATNEYTTIVIVHGHSFHSGIFARILPFAKLHGFRVICISRRGYQGSTPYTPEEKSLIESNSTEDHQTFLSSQGVLLGLFIDGIIERYSLPEAGGVAVLGWSMGNIFPMALLAAVNSLPSEVKRRLQRYLNAFICWDAPTVVFGIPLPERCYYPLFDSSLTPQERGAAFKTWVSGYFQHGNSQESTRELSQLMQRNLDTSTQVWKPTVDTMTIQEHSSVFDGAAGLEFDNPVVDVTKGPLGFERALQNLTSESLFNSEIRKEWARLRISFVYGECVVWVVVFAMWEIEERARRAGIKYECVSGANHFMMWDEPERFVTVVKKVISSLNAPI